MSILKWAERSFGEKLREVLEARASFVFLFRDTMEIAHVNDITLLCDCSFSLFAFLLHFNLISESIACPKCSSTCHIIAYNNDFHFRCRQQKHGIRCSFKRSAKTGTWFQKCRLSYEAIFHVIYSFVHNLEVKQTSTFFNISTQTIIDYFNFCREICIEFCLRQKQAIGGPGKVVEIDESKFGKRKYNRGKHVDGQWVFGGVERDSNNCFFVPVETRDSETLVSIIKTYIRPGTTIISDCWKAYTCLSKEGYEHLTVNHSVCFKDPETGAHTNRIESFWGAVKRSIPSTGRTKNHFDGYLAAYLWRKQHPKNAFENFLKEMALQFPPT